MTTPALTRRQPSCSCGQLRLTCEDEPVRIAMCHCLACQQRTGSVFGVQARFRRDQVISIEGVSTPFVRTGDSGGRITFHFCPTCGSTVYFELARLPDFITVPVGAFAHPPFPRPTVSIYEKRKHPWVVMPDLEIDHAE